MKILVTGGTGVIGEGLIPAILESGNTVRLLSRGAEDDAQRWPEEVEPFAADITDVKSLSGAAAGCGAVVHITGIVEESPPSLTFERVNVGGTKNILAEAKRSKVKRFLYISSLGAERGTSDYHHSKFRAEELVRAFRGDWLILRPGNVYGPGDEVISSLLKFIRSLPAIPVIDSGDQKFQPIWYEDLGQAIRRALEVPELKRQTIELAGAEVTTMNDLIDRLLAITGRSVARVPVPSLLASVGIQVAELTGLEKIIGMKIPLSDAKLRMLLEENVIEPGEANGLTDVLNINPTPLDEGLGMLADMLPEQLPSDGVGSLKRKRFWADIKNSRYSQTELLAAFRLQCAEIMPLEFSAEPDTPRVIEEGATLTLALPLRGNVQVRVEEVATKRITFSTVEGHMLAGMVQFITAKQKKFVRFMIEIHSRAANSFDQLALNTIGDLMQSSNWEAVVERVIKLSGGEAHAGVQSETITLNDEEAEEVELRLKSLVDERKRAQSEEEISKAASKNSTGALRTTRKRRENSRTKSRATQDESHPSGGRRKTTSQSESEKRSTASKRHKNRGQIDADGITNMMKAATSLATAALEAATTVTAQALKGANRKRRPQSVKKGPKARSKA